MRNVPHPAEDDAPGRDGDVVFAKDRSAENTDHSLEGALEALYPWARRVAILLCRDRHQAEDLVQDAFVQALRRPPKPPTQDAVRAWLRVVIFRLYLRRRRSAFREARALMRLRSERPAEPVPGGSDEVLQALRRLSPRQRACVVLRYFEDMPEGEVARVLTLSHGTVKAHLAQGRERLRLLLAEST